MMIDRTRDVALDLILTLFTCGAWNLFVQYQQIKTLNHLLQENRFSYWKMYFFSLLTCGIYFIYHEYQKSQAFGEFLSRTQNQPLDTLDPVLAAVFAAVGLNIVYDAILQSKINTYLTSQSLKPLR